jgi:hypothetical protein
VSEGDPITLPDGVEGIIAHIPESEVWRRPASEGRTDMFVDTFGGRRLVLASEWESDA